MFFGALFVLFQGDKFGRKPMIIVRPFIMAIGTAISVASFGPHWGLGEFVLGRVITGIGKVWIQPQFRYGNQKFLRPKIEVF